MYIYIYIYDTECYRYISWIHFLKYTFSFIILLDTSRTGFIRFYSNTYVIYQSLKSMNCLRAVNRHIRCNQFSIMEYRKIAWQKQVPFPLFSNSRDKHCHINLYLQVLRIFMFSQLHYTWKFLKPNVLFIPRFLLTKKKEESTI